MADFIGPRNHPFAAGPSADQWHRGEQNADQRRAEQFAAKQSGDAAVRLLRIAARGQPFRRFGQQCQHEHTKTAGIAAS